MPQPTVLHSHASDAEFAGRPRRRRAGRVREAHIDIENLRLRTFIGFNPEERAKQQDVVINIAIRYPMAEAVLDDVVEQALDYKSITKAVIYHVENGRFLLLEKLVADVLDICCEHADVSFARVRIDKPHALRFADSVAVTQEYRAEDKNTNAEDMT